MSFPPDPAANAPRSSSRSSSGSPSTRPSNRVGPADRLPNEVTPEIPVLAGTRIGPRRSAWRCPRQPPSTRRTTAAYGDNATFTNSLRGRGPLVTWHFNCVVRVPRRRAGRLSATRPERNWLPSNWRTYGRRNHNMPCQQRPQDEGSERRLSRHTPSRFIRCFTPSAASRSMGFIVQVTPR